VHSSVGLGNFCPGATGLKPAIGAWLDALDARVPKNVVVVAMASKLAWIAWALLSSAEDYRPIGNIVAA
jgi:transposase